MNEDTTPGSSPDANLQSSGYTPPAISYLGTLADLTQKTVGASDGSTFLGLDIGSI
ncbi:MAG: hypothetical protein QOI99_1650 [Actinomycetota bacterium]|jgi:hypothetical protein|nr:hypothetical protein [Actinomycetota bacterium]